MDETPQLIIHYKLPRAGLRKRSARTAFDWFETELVSAIRRLRAGQVEGMNFDEEYAMLYLGGPDANALLEAIRAAVTRCPLPSGSFLLSHSASSWAPDLRIEL